MTTPTFRSKQHAVITSGGNDVTVAAEPAGTVQGDVIYAVVRVGRFGDNNLTSITQPSGWTVLHTWPWIFAGESYFVQLSAIRRGASAPSLVWAHNAASSYCEAALWTWQDVPTGTFYTGTPAFSADGLSGHIPDPPAISGAVSGDAIFILSAVSTATASLDSATAPSGYTIRDGGTIASGCLICASKVSAGGAEDPGAFGGIGANDWSLATATLNLGSTGGTLPSTVSNFRFL